jgi:hypothetical protein
LTKMKKYDHDGRLNIKIHILFYEDNPWSVALRQMRFGKMKNHVHNYVSFFDGALNMFVFRNFEVMLE